MKVVLVLLMSLLAANSFADDDQNQAKAQFAKMSASQAWNSVFKKQIFDFQMPGSSTWINPVYGACIDGNTMRTLRPVSKCVAWTGKNNSGDKVTVYNLVEANKCDLACSATKNAILSSPMNYEANICTLWSAKGGDDDNWQVKYFNTKKDAENYSARAECARWEVVTKALPRNFEVKFFRNELQSHRYLGKHTYAIRSCNEQ